MTRTKNNAKATSAKIQSYEAILNDGRKTRVTIPEDPRPEELLIDAIRENLTPHAAAAIASWLQPANTNDARVDAEIRWFADLLAQELGGWKQQSRLAEELGL